MKTLAELLRINLTKNEQEKPEDIVSERSVRLVLHDMERNYKREYLDQIQRAIHKIVEACDITKDHEPHMKGDLVRTVQEAGAGIYILYIDKNLRLVAREDNSTVYLQDRNRIETILQVFDVNNMWLINLQLFFATRKMIAFKDFVWNGMIK